MSEGYFRKIIHIRAEDSPNVKLALKEISLGRKPSNRTIIPGVLSYSQYNKRRKLWDKVLQCISLDGEFYEGEEIKLFPMDWLKFSYSLWNTGYTQAKVLGVDTAEGGDNTCSCVVGDQGLIELISKKTPDTSVIPDDTIELMKTYNIPANKVFFDTGGGGKEHADILRKRGYPVNTVFFGEAATPPKKLVREWESKESKLDKIEVQKVYKNRRAELYHESSLKCNPAYGGFALPPPSKKPQYEELYRQLNIMPKLYNAEGQLYLPPKKARPNNKEDNLEKMLGCSPDEADAFVLAVWGLEDRGGKVLVL